MLYQWLLTEGVGVGELNSIIRRKKKKAFIKKHNALYITQDMRKQLRMLQTHDGEV